MVEVTEVTEHIAPSGAVEAAAIETPRPGTQIRNHVIAVRGWCLEQTRPVIAVELGDGDIVAARGRVHLASADLGLRFPHNPSAGSARFAVAAALAGMAPLSLHLTAVLSDGSRVNLATIRARRIWAQALSAIGAPLVSVVIPCFDQGRFLGQAIESVLAQTYPLFEIVVVDDGSHDNTGEVARRYPGVTHVRQRNAGVAAARNAGLRRSRGSYIVFMDADDRLRPNALHMGLSELATDPTLAFVAGQCVRVEFDGAVRRADSAPIVETDHYAELMRNCFIWTSAAVMFRRTALEFIGAYDRSFGASADHDLFLRMARACRIGCHGEVVAEYRRHASNMTRDAALSLRDRLAVLRHQRRTSGHFEPYQPAYRAGVAFARAYFGRPLVAAVVSDVATGHWRRAARGYRTLVTCHPHGAISALWSLIQLLPRAPSHARISRQTDRRRYS